MLMNSENAEDQDLAMQALDQATTGAEHFGSSLDNTEHLFDKYTYNYFKYSSNTMQTRIQLELIELSIPR